MPRPWTPVPLGTTVELPLGPGIGVLELPEPSRDRVTYYGPIENTRLGRALLEVDMLLTRLLDGIDWRTGNTVPPPNVDGFMTSLERFARARSKDASQDEDADPPSETRDVRRWWAGMTWLVWVPERVVLRLTDDESALEFAESRMKLAVWTADEKDRTPAYEEFGEQVTRHFAELAKEIVVLQQFEEAAKAVSVVRWLKKEDVPVDLSWAKSYELMPMETPAAVRRYSVSLSRDQEGKPITFFARDEEGKLIKERGKSQ